jgi:hypothetical protein
MDAVQGRPVAVRTGRGGRVADFFPRSSYSRSVSRVPPLPSSVVVYDGLVGGDAAGGRRWLHWRLLLVKVEPGPGLVGQRLGEMRRSHTAPAAGSLRCARTLHPEVLRNSPSRGTAPRGSSLWQREPGRRHAGSFRRRSSGSCGVGGVVVWLTALTESIVFFLRYMSRCGLDCLIDTIQRLAMGA